MIGILYHGFFFLFSNTAKIKVKKNTKNRYFLPIYFQYFLLKQVIIRDGEKFK